jgi:DNA-binding response OmpR family regulator
VSSKVKVLIVEDEPDMAMGIKDNLEFEGYEVLTAATGEAALQILQKEKPACVLLDIMLPGIDGFETCQRMRKGGCRSPMVMLTARGQEIDKVRGLELGADDYITKPFGLRELLARIHAVLRRATYPAGREMPDEIKIGKSVVCFSKGRVLRGRREEVSLGYYEGEILKTLYAKQGQVVERKDILSEIWGLENEPMNRSVDNHVVSLRRKIEEDPREPRHLLTVHGFGYKLVI